MFLDPDPRPPKHSTMSGFSSSQNPAVFPRDNGPGARRPLNERTKSENNQRRPSQSPEKPTVRLVRPSPAPESPATRVYDNSSSPLNVLEYTVGEIGSPTFRVQDETSGLKAAFSDPNWAYHVSDSTRLAGQAQTKDQKSTDASRPPPALQLAPLKSKWHRRSTSSGYNSESSTLKGSEFAFSQKSRKSERLSQGTTVQGTPPPTELGFRGRPEEEEVPKLGPASTLQTLQEASPERPTIRAVTPSIASSPHAETRPGTGASGPSYLRFHSLPPDPAPGSATVSRSNSKRTWSTGSVAPALQDFQSSPVIRVPAPRPQRSEESMASTEAALPTASSPNFISFSPDSARPRSRSQPLRDVSSFDSINSRLQASREGPEQSVHGLVTSPSWSSTQSNDTVPSLQVSRKRLRHASAQPSFSSQMNSDLGSRNSSSLANWDTTQYRRQGFQSQLSTIASMSEQQSRDASRHMSHFSLGSGVTTIDDGDRTQLSVVWPPRRRQDVPVESLVSEPNSNGALSSNSGDEAGDMTLGIFREESAKPPPLFMGDSTLGESTIIAAGTQQQQYDGIPHLMSTVHKDGEGDEMFDTLGALQTVPLHQKRSGRSLRQRSNSTPSSHSRQQSMASYVESDRWSYGSSIFPTWAKHYYGGTAVFSSKVSLATFGPLDRPAFHSRHSSTWTERSNPSRLGTGYSNVESNSGANSAFIPRFFRPPARMGFRTPGSGTSRNSRTTRWIQSSQPTTSTEPESRPDSMAILPDPISSLHGNYAPETIPSSPPEWISPSEEPISSSQSHLQVPQAYENQRQWDSLEYPRPMTKDETREFRFTDPHLAPSRRNAQSRLSMWPPPSFVESLDTLIHSRCNRQILLFGLGFLCPLLWMLGAILPLPKRPMSSEELGQSLAQVGDDEVQAAMVKHEAGDSDRRWQEERTFLKARWWRVLNRVMSFVGVLVIGTIIALAVIATH